MASSDNIYSLGWILPAYAAGQAGPDKSDTQNSLITWRPQLLEEFEDLNSQWQTANWSNGNPFNATWQGDNISFKNGIMTLTLDNQGCPGACRDLPYASGEYRSNSEYGYGYYEVRMKATRGDGLVTSFFTYTGDYGQQNHHEIDFEILGKDPTKVQLNYYVAGQGNHEFIYDLKFDASKEFHNYGFKWSESELIFYVDGKEVHRVTGNVPSQPGKIMVSFWPGTGVDGWLKPFKYPGHPLKAQYDWIKHSPLNAKAAELINPPALAPTVITETKATQQKHCNKCSLENTDQAKAMLAKSWENYKKEMIAADGRPLCVTDAQLKINNTSDDLDLDGDVNEFTTLSEGVSYVLTRAVLMGDKETFDRVWQWAQKNLQRTNISQVYDAKEKKWVENEKKDHLFAWRYHDSFGGRPGGILSQDIDAATDGDQDIAAALLLAHRRWGSDAANNYQGEARDILKDIWEKETVKTNNGQRILIGGDAQSKTKNPKNGADTYGVNPSYFRPSYYEQLFAEEDAVHDWKSMVAPSYQILENSADTALHNDEGKTVKGQVNLVPDWVAVDEELNIVDHGWKQGDKSSNDYYFGGDAFRSLFWMALQHQLNPNDQAAKDYLSQDLGIDPKNSGPFAFLKKELKDNNTIYCGYTIDGKVLWQTTSLQTLAVYMYYFHAAGDHESAKKIYNLIISDYNFNSEGFWRGSKEYYGQNWMWLALYAVSAGITFDKDKFTEIKGDDSLLPEGQCIPPPEKLQPINPDTLSKDADYNPNEIFNTPPQIVNLDNLVIGIKDGQLVFFEPEAVRAFRVLASNAFISTSKSSSDQLNCLKRLIDFSFSSNKKKIYHMYPLEHNAQPSWIAKTLSILINNVNTADKAMFLLELLNKVTTVSPEVAELLKKEAGDAQFLQANGLSANLRFKLYIILESYCIEKGITHPGILGDIDYFLSLFASDRQQAKDYLNKAKQHFLDIKNSQDSQNIKNILGKFQPDINTDSQFNDLLLQSRQRLAEITYNEAGFAAQPSDKLRLYINALAMVSNLLNKLKGMELLSATQLISSILVDLAALIIRNPELKNDLRKSFPELDQVATADNRTDIENVLLDWAQEYIKNILKWQDKYNGLAKVDEESSNYSPWLYQIVLQAKITQVKCHIWQGGKVENIQGEIDDLHLNHQQSLNLGGDLTLAYFSLREKNMLAESDKCYNLAQKLLTVALGQHGTEKIKDNPEIKKDTELQIRAQALLWLGKIEGVEAERSEENLLKASGLIEESIEEFSLLTDDEQNRQQIAEAKRTLAEIKARRAFLFFAQNNGAEGEKLMNEAINLLTEAENNGNEYTRTSANLWLAKIYSYNYSYYKGDRDEKVREAHKDDLKKASEQLDNKHALARNDYGFVLSGSELSAAYQVTGDIAVSENRFDDAIALYRTATKTWEFNFDARNSLGDVLGWQNSYSEAAKEYDYVLKNAKPNSSEYFRGRLGLVDLKSYQLEYEDARSKYQSIYGEIVKLNSSDTEIIRLQKRAKLSYCETYIRNEDYSIVAAEKVPATDKLLTFCKGHKNKYRYNNSTGTLVIKGEMTEEEKKDLQALYSKQEDKNAIESLFHRSHIIIIIPKIIKTDTELDIDANEFVTDLITKEPAGSSILIRAMQLALELADAYYSIDEVNTADTLVGIVKNDPRSSDILKLKARLREARRFSFLGEKKEANKAYQEVLAQYKAKALDKLTVEELSMLAEASLNFEHQIDDPDDRHYEYIKAIFTELLARRLTTCQRMRIYLDYAAFISHADDEKQQEKAAKLFKHVIMQYLDGIYRNLLPTELKKSERFLLAEAYYGLAELKRWGEDKDLDTAEKYYHSAMVALVRKEDGSNKDQEGIKNDTRAVKDLRYRALFGRGQAYEAMGSGIRAQQDSEAAYGLKKEISAQNRDDLRIFRSRVYPKLISVSEKCIKNSKNEQECREQLGASLPVPGTDGRAEVGVTQNFDRDGKDKTIASTNITAKAHAELGKTTQLDIETQVKVNQTQNKDGRTELLRQPDILTNFNLRNQYVNAMLATTHDIQYPEYNISKFLNLSSVYGSAMLNLSGFTDLPIISGLGIGADYNYYTFLYEGSQKERQNISLSLRANWDVGRIARDFGWYPRWLPEGLLNLRFYSNWPYYEWMAYKDYSNHENATGTQGTFHALRGKVGGGASFNFYRWTRYLPFTLDFNIEYSRQFSHIGWDLDNRRFVEKDYKQTSYDVTLWLNVPDAVEWLKHPYLKKPDPSEQYYKFYNPDFNPDFPEDR